MPVAARHGSRPGRRPVGAEDENAKYGLRLGSGDRLTVRTQLTYSGIGSTKLTVGVKNLTDRDPPYTNLTSKFLGGYDIS